MLTGEKRCMTGGGEQQVRVFISSTAMDLAAYRAAAQQVVLEHDWHPILLMEHQSVPGGLIVPSCQRLVQSCDVLVLIAGHRCGWIPSPSDGGDGVTSITQLEFAAWGARARARPTRAPIILLADDPAVAFGSETAESDVARASQLVFRARLKATHIVHGFLFVSEAPRPTGRSELMSGLLHAAARKPHEDAVQGFRTLLSNHLSKVKSEIADRRVAEAQHQVQAAKSDGWVKVALGVGFGLLLANMGNSDMHGHGNDEDDQYDGDDQR